ncbi:helix-turn-helix transcriptional regulator [Limobrevibacterium gyesilva]|uniref:Shikimate kinase n=1 Tax=Limobrevibacterium gyesilva TaxID=2991712 RepID=A0AA42CGZ5_9PROT|nr:helix-turn-helix transcriptional regulator [Limobrevibacterium gyesilva]MCW3476656.1 helix-turn-helix transcriptional regulator [Limobrevibacterium gyesilva]
MAPRPDEGERFLDALKASPRPGAPPASDDAAFLHGVGERLRLLRARRGMTRRILSRQSGVSERYIAQMEAGGGNVSILLLRAIARALGVPATDLLADQPEHAADTALLDDLLARLTPDQRREARALLARHFGAQPHPGRATRIALIGLRGAGKSSLGRRLAEQRRVPFYELDREIEREAGTELREIFELHGQGGFRRLERAALERLLATGSGAVIATGGSIVADAATFALLLSHCRTVWVRAAPEEHMQRVLDQGDLRPMQDNRQAMKDLRAILASRESLYARADHILDTSGQTLDESVNALVTLLK